MTTIVDRSEGKRVTIDWHVRQNIKRRQTDDMLSKGYKRLGAGCYGIVFEDPNDPHTVVKVGTYDLDEFDRDGWLLYVRTFANHPSPHRPRVHSVELFPDHYVARMERLREPETDEEKAVWHRCDGRIRTPSAHEGTFGEFGKELERAAPAANVLDCHKGNIMFRNDGTPVFTDPFAQ